MGKLFTGIINDILQNFSEKYVKTNECQAGFRREFSTIDNIFVQNTVIDLLQNSRKICFAHLLTWNVLLILSREVGYGINWTYLR